MKKKSKVEDELKQKQIQGLFEAREAEDRIVEPLNRREEYE